MTFVMCTGQSCCLMMQTAELLDKGALSLNFGPDSRFGIGFWEWIHMRKGSTISAIGRPSTADTQGKVEKETLSQKFAALLTGLYAEQQAAAAEKCGVSGGESWRVAFESASNSGARQVCKRSTWALFCIMSGFGPCFLYTGVGQDRLRMSMCLEA